MGHRHVSNSFNMFGINEGHNHNFSAEQSYIPMGGAVAPENGSFVSPMDNMSMGGVHHDPQWNLEGRSNEYSSSNFSMEVQHFPPSFSGPSLDPNAHSSAPGNLYLVPESNAGLMHSSYYNRQATHHVEDGLLVPTTGTHRGSFKRKGPGISGACEGGSTSRFYGAGSSSGSSQMLLGNPTSDYQSTGPSGLPQYRGSSLSIAGDGSLRNVRSRSRLDFEPNTTRSRLSSYPSHLYPSTNLPTNQSGMADLGNLNADATSREWNCIPISAAAHGRIGISDLNGSSPGTNPFLVGRSAADIGVCHHNSVSSGHPVSSRYFHNHPTQAAREDHSSHSQRAIPPYRTGLSYSHLGHEAASSDTGLHLNSESFSSRYSRPSAAGVWHHSYRNGRSRIAIERLQSISSVVDADRMGPEALPMVHGSSLYGGSRNWFDQYRDMRLEVDAMSYEELLALGERIGNVSTGLSEDTMSKCLMENIYNSANQNHKEGSCVICIEEYKNGERVGTLNNCGHEYHVGCIKKWLLVKNVCPICKAAALPECSN